MRAAERETSVSALVRQFLIDIASCESEAERLARDEARLREAISTFRAGDRLSRDETHARRL